MRIMFLKDSKKQINDKNCYSCKSLNDLYLYIGDQFMHPLLLGYVKKGNTKIIFDLQTDLHIMSRNL